MNTVLQQVLWHRKDRPVGRAYGGSGKSLLEPERAAEILSHGHCLVCRLRCVGYRGSSSSEGVTPARFSLLSYDRDLVEVPNSGPSLISLPFLWPPALPCPRLWAGGGTGPSVRAGEGSPRRFGEVATTFCIDHWDASPSPTLRGSALQSPGNLWSPLQLSSRFLALCLITSTRSSYIYLF